MSPEDIYLLHRDKVFRLCLRFCGGNMALAEDITHDVFVKMLEHLGDLSELTSLDPWFYRVATNACYTRMNRDSSIWAKVRRALLLSAASTTTTPEKELQLRQELQQTLDILKTLPPNERIVFCMHYLDELPQQEISSILSLSKGYVSKLLKRAKKRVAERRLEEAYV